MLMYLTNTQYLAVDEHYLYHLEGDRYIPFGEILFGHIFPCAENSDNDNELFREIETGLSYVEVRTRLHKYLINIDDLQDQKNPNILCGNYRFLETY